MVFPIEADNSLKSTLQRRNTECNIAKGGFAAYDDDWIYYSSKSSMWKVKNDNSSKTKISGDTIDADISATNANASRYWIFAKLISITVKIGYLK